MGSVIYISQQMCEINTKSCFTNNCVVVTTLFDALHQSGSQNQGSSPELSSVDTVITNVSCVISVD